MKIKINGKIENISVYKDCCTNCYYCILNNNIYKGFNLADLKEKLNKKLPIYSKGSLNFLIYLKYLEDTEIFTKVKFKKKDKKSYAQSLKLLEKRLKYIEQRDLVIKKFMEELKGYKPFHIEDYDWVEKPPKNKKIK